MLFEWEYLFIFVVQTRKLFLGSLNAFVQFSRAIVMPDKGKPCLSAIGSAIE
jgi:hypothetical protein